jgi:hypothetical protein
MPIRTRRSCYWTPTLVVLCLLLGRPALGQQQDTAIPPPIDFSRQIKPILSDRCFLCHGPDAEAREADLRLDLEEPAMAVIDLGDAEASELYHRIMEDGEEQMPPQDSKLSLTNDEKDLIKRWIDEGAKWEAHWSFVRPGAIDVPQTKGKEWIRNKIDSFVLQRMKQEKVTPGLPASREKLLRRVTFDLTGLPPTLEELDAFLADEPSSAYEKVVDRLLKSPRYGERMASDWLDLARYSDTYGYQVDRDRHVWPWRDWVVRAFNGNMSYRQFIIEQIAGDLLPNATEDQILATTFNRLHPQKVEGGSVEEEFRVEYVADRSQTMSTAFMGLTVECARCHDHKYDPISQKEYYQLFAFFNNIDEAGLYSWFDPESVPTPSMLLLTGQQKSQRKQLESSLQDAEVALAAHRKANEFDNWLKDVAERKPLAKELPGQILAADFKTTKNGNNKLVGGPQQLQALRLTGDDEVRFEEVGNFDRDQPFTLVAHIKVPADEQLLKRAVIVHHSRAWTDSASRGYQLLIEDGKLSASLIHFWPGNAISVRTQQLVATDEWIHVAMVYDGSSSASGLQILIDGKPVPLEIVRDDLQKTIKGVEAEHLILGARFRDAGFKEGYVADLQQFDRRLSTLEVSSLINNASRQSTQQLLQKSTDQLSEAETQLLREFYLTVVDSQSTELQEIVRERRTALNEFIDGVDEIMVMREMPSRRQAYILNRGAYDQHRDPVDPATPAMLPPIPAGQNADRLGLAHWLASPEHPLTARVAVNHYWQLIYGQGLVRTPEDFGSQGAPPTHPELLDWLATDFQQNGWDIQRLLKMMVMSATYQQSTFASAELLKRDPENQFLARASTYRLPAEMLRDNVLFASGLMVEQLGGPPARPYELEESFVPSTPDQGAGLYRRSLYTYWKRAGPAPVMLTLDAATRDVCNVKRERTSSPLAALVQLNNPQTVEASRKLAEQLLAKHGEDNSRIIVDLFRTLTSRTPVTQESAVLEKLFLAQRDYFENNSHATYQFLAVGESKSQSDEPTTLAAWSSVANTLLNFDECVMKR